MNSCCAKNNTNNTKNVAFQTLISIPWCCVGSLVLILLGLFSSVIPLVGVSEFDSFFHKWLLAPAVLLHLFGIYRYLFVEGHKTRKMNIIYIFLTTLFIVSMFFHFSDLHDDIFNHSDHNEVQSGPLM